MSDSLPDWAVDAFRADGSLRDIYIRGVSAPNWEMVMDATRARYPWTFTRDGIEQPFPDTMEAVFADAQRSALTLTLDVTGIDIRCHFFTADEIEFDLAPNDVDTPERIDAVIEFMRSLAGWSGRIVELTEENAPQHVLLRAAALGSVAYVGPTPHRAV